MIEWKEYKLNDVFIVKNCKTINSPYLSYTNDISDIPHISRQRNYNGIKGYVKTPPQEKINQGHCLCIDMFLNCSWQERNFLAVDHILTARNDNLTKYNSLFVKTIIENTKNNITFSNIFCEEKSDLIISLPTINNEIAWDLMDRYIRRLESKILDKKKINIENELLNKPVDMSNWKEFNFFDIFDKNYQIGDSKKITTLEGDIALVSAGESNNGIDSFVKYNENNKLFNENQITLAKNGSVGTMNYQNQKFYATSDIMVLKLKDYELNKYIALFLKVFCEREFKLNYSWSNKITLKVLEKTKIKLPTTQNGEIDWQYMEDFMKNVEKEAIIN